MPLILRIAALLFFVLGLLVGLGWLDPSGDWQPAWTFAFAGLFCWCLSDTVPPART
jgi:membrane-bound metal-dependent hydrolase YbcI (DUF457 family)